VSDDDFVIADEDFLEKKMRDAWPRFEHD